MVCLVFSVRDQDHVVWIQRGEEFLQYLSLLTFSEEALTVADLSMYAILSMYGDTYPTRESITRTLASIAAILRAFLYLLICLSQYVLSIFPFILIYVNFAFN